MTQREQFRFNVDTENNNVQPMLEADIVTKKRNTHNSIAPFEIGRTFFTSLATRLFLSSS